MNRLVAYGPVETDGGDLDVVLAGVTLLDEGGLVVALELADGTTVTLRMAADAVSRPDVLESGRSAAA